MSVKTFSGSEWINGFYTRLSVMMFVAKHWRRGSAIIIMGGFLVALVALIAKVVAPEKAPYAWGLIAVSAVSAIVVLIYRFTILHNPRAYGGEHQRLVLDAKRLIDKKPHFKSGEGLHFSKIRPRTATAQIIEVKHFDNIETANWVEFDTEISKHLLNGHIVCQRNENDNYIHFGPQEILDERETVRDTQVEVLNILRRDALENGKSFFDARKLSLGSIYFEHDELCCKLGRTSYFCSMVTNDAAAKVIATEMGKVHDDQTLTLYPAIGRRGSKVSETIYELTAIGDTVGLSNHIGSVVVAVSSDGIPVLCFQTKSATINAGKSVLSGSGSLEFEDFHNSGADKTGHLDDAVRFGMARELLEETGGIPQDSYREFDRARLRAYSKKIQLAGFYRDLRRGAFPIFVGFCRMEANFAQIKDRTASAIWGIKAPVETRIDEALPPIAVGTVDEYQKYLRDYIKPGKDIVRTPSDQVLIIEALLEIDEVAEHFQRVLDNRD
jgi:hypothetical protein